MGNIIKFTQGVKGVRPPKAFTCSLNRALLTVQYCVLVLGDVKTAGNLLQALAAGELGEMVVLPGQFRDIVEEVDTAATYRAALGCRNEDD